MRVVGDAPAADGRAAAVLGAGAVDAVHAHVVVLGIAAPAPWAWAGSSISRGFRPVIGSKDDSVIRWTHLTQGLNRVRVLTHLNQLLTS